MVRHGIANMLVPMMRLAGHSYIAGPELQDAVSVAHRLSTRGYASSIAYWDPAGASPQEVLAAYVAGARELAASASDSYLSVKVPSVDFDRALIAKLVAECARTNLRLHFDSLGPETADRTFQLADELLHEYRNLTLTLPGCWLRSVEDADWVVERRVGVRVVKGQWPDPSDGEVDPVRGYFRVVDALAGRAKHVAVASHNPAVVEPALTRLLKAGTSCELELLYGLPVGKVLPVAERLGVRTRIYIPYGYGWLPYSLSQARRNPKIVWWILKDMVQPHHRTGIYGT